MLDMLSSKLIYLLGNQAVLIRGIDIWDIPLNYWHQVMDQYHPYSFKPVIIDSCIQIDFYDDSNLIGDPITKTFVMIMP